MSDSPINARETQVGQRMQIFAERFWDGNQSRMAKDLGTSTATMSRLLSGRQMPTFAVLSALARRCEINIAWLLTGEGDPIIAAGAGRGGGAHRPIAERLLPGPPESHRDLLGGESYPIAHAFYSTTNYWLRIQDFEGLGGRNGVIGGDLILMETRLPSEYRPSSPRAKFCGVRLKHGRRQELVLAYVARVPRVSMSYDSDYEIFTTDIYAPRETRFPLPDRVEFVVPGRDGAMPTAPPDSDTHLITVDDVVCISVKLERTFRE